jgi:hypothetical protein
MADNIDMDDFPADLDDDAAQYQARCVFLGKHPKNYDFYLEPGPGNLRIIRCRRGDRYLPTPEALAGAYTDSTTAARAVTTYIANRGKPNPLPINGIVQKADVKDELDLAIEQDVGGDETEQELPAPPPVIDLTDPNAKAPDDVEESITIRTRRAAAAAKKK